MQPTESQDDTTRPTFEEAFAEDDSNGDDSDPSPESSSSQASDADPSAEAPTSPPTLPLTDETGDREIPGPVPPERVKAILERERSKHAQELGKLGWARQAVESGLTEESFTTLLQEAVILRHNPAEFAERNLRAVLNHPQHGPALREWMADAIGQQQEQGSVSPDDRGPQPDFQLPDGTPFFSAAQQEKREAWLRQQFRSDVTKDIAPLIERDKAVRESEAVRAYDAQEQGKAVQEFAEWKDAPYFEQCRPGIRALMQATNYRMPLASAYLKVFREQFPNLQLSDRTKVIAELQTQAHAGNGVRPRAVAPSTSARPKSFKAIPKEEWEDA